MQHISMNNCGFGLFLRVNRSSFKCDWRIIAINEGKSKNSSWFNFSLSDPVFSFSSYHKSMTQTWQDWLTEAAQTCLKNIMAFIKVMSCVVTESISSVMDGTHHAFIDFVPLRLSCSFLILLTNQYFWVASYLHKYVMRTIHWKSHQSDTFPFCLVIFVMWLYLTMSRWQKDVQTIVIIERT